MIGKRFGDFEIKEEIGRGGMGSVYKARQISLNRYVAIKILPRNLSNDDEFVERFDIEAKAVASLIHQNIIQMYSKGVMEDGTHYFAMEYVDGEDLSFKIKSGVRFSEKKIIDIIIQACQGLESSWRRNIIHRDIKPGNLIITKDGVLKIADFGLVKCTEATKKLTRTNVYLGTVHYSSPEQGEGKPLDHRADIYSLGIVLYQLLTNKVPFEGETPSSVIYKHVYEAPVSPKNINPNLSPQIEAVVLKAIAKRPDDRYQNIVEFREALESVKQMWSDKMMESTAAPAEKMKGISRGRRNVIVIVALLILLIGGTVMFAIISPPLKTEPGRPQAEKAEIQARKEQPALEKARQRQIMAAGLINTTTEDLKRDLKELSIKDIQTPQTPTITTIKPKVDEAGPLKQTEKLKAHVISEFNVLILSSGDPDKTEIITMFVAEGLSRKKKIHLIDKSIVPNFATQIDIGNDRIDIKEFYGTNQTIGDDVIPHIIVLANIETIGKTELKYYGQSKTQYTTSVSIKAIFTKDNRVISDPLVKNVKFTDLNVYNKIKEVVQPMAESLAQQIERFIKSFK